MTLGEGIVWATCITLTALAIYFISVKGGWRTVGKVFVVLVLLGTLFGAGIWGWYWYQDRPQVLTGLGKVSFGMSPVEVKIALGKPDTDETDTDEEKLRRTFLYNNPDGSMEDYVAFFDEDGKGFRASIICKGSYANVFGLTTYSSEQEVLAKLGEPSSTSIHVDGLLKAISYNHWKVGFEVEKGRVNIICATESGGISYPEEYSEEAS